MSVLAVNEIFGPTIQGEGVNIGVPTMFLRLTGCNQHCVFCDTPYTWDWTGRNGKVYNRKDETHLMSTDEVLATLLAHPGAHTKHLVISGGEPMLQQRRLIALTNALRLEHGWFTEIETAGTIIPLGNLVDLFTISPKLKSSGNDDLRINSNALHRFADDAPNRIFKFVVSTMDDLKEVDQLVHDYRLTRVYVMPEGIEREKINERMQTFVDAVIERGYILTTRLQIQLYGNRRGV